MTIDKAKVLDFKGEVDYTSGGIVSKQILKSKGGNITLFSFDEGQALSEHTAPFDALLQVMEGTAEIMISREIFEVRAGEAIILPASIPHGVKALSPFKMLLTMIREQIS